MRYVVFFDLDQATENKIHPALCQQLQEQKERCQHYKVESQVQ